MLQKILIGTVLLEKNRWLSKIPSFNVSDWIERFIFDGFDGIEIWENHVCSNDEEFNALLKFKKYIIGFNSYVDFDDSEASRIQREKVAEYINSLECEFVKFNFGNDLSKADEYIYNLLAWSKSLHPDIDILCECHHGTIMENTDIANGVFAKLNDDRFGAIIHPLSEVDKLDIKISAYGKRIRHLHMQLMNSQFDFVDLNLHSDLIRDFIEKIDKLTHDYTCTVEFTKGCGKPDERIEELYKNAVKDMNLIRKSFGI